VAAFGSGSSFSLYALHFPIAMAIIAWLSNGLRRQPSLALLGQTLAIMAFLFVVAYVFSRVTEAKTDTIRMALKRIVIRPAPAAVPANAPTPDQA
jgi:peptidoglycan/LPS O-acetylase OafA/YrhL